MRYIACTLTLFLISCSIVFAEEPNLDSLYNALDNAIQKRNDFDKTKEFEVATLKKLLFDNLSLENRYEICNKIIFAYINYNFDSTLKYIETNYEIGKTLKNQFYISNCRILFAMMYLRTGRETDALKAINSINRNAISDRLLIRYYRLQYDYNLRISRLSYSNEDKQYHYSIADRYSDSLISISPEGTGLYLELIESKHYYREEFEQSLNINSQRLAIENPVLEYFPYVIFFRASIYRRLNQLEMAKKYYILSAIRDIELSRKNNAALTELAFLAFNENRIELANKYINIAMEDARFYNSRYRFMYLATSLPVINKVYMQNIRKQKSNLRNYSIVLTGLSVLLFVAVFFVYIQMRKLSTARKELRKLNKNLKDFNTKLSFSNNSLKESNHVKEIYIGHFLQICSQYIDKLDNYRKMVNREIANRNVSELFEMTKSKLIIEREQYEFYKNFDKTFLTIYPNFVERINELVLPNEKIVLNEGELLNTELRVLALMRLGIKDSPKIAKLLRYSITTIYNYRTQLKNKACGNRELFEDQVLKIGANL